MVFHGGNKKWPICIDVFPGSVASIASDVVCFFHYFFIFLYLYSCILEVSFFQRLPFNNQTQLLLSEINLVALCKEGAFSLLNVTFELTEKGLDAVEEIGSGKPLWRGEKMSM